MIALRKLAYAAVVSLIACSSSTPQQRIDAAEISQFSELKQKYAGVLMGFDIRPETTLIASLDLQHYIETDDDTIAAMKRDTLARWRAVWSDAHPHEHATLQVRFIDFIGRKVAEESTKV
jgi:hypothetical protein